jgi:hypothetical protein
MASRDDLERYGENVRDEVDAAALFAPGLAAVVMTYGPRRLLRVRIGGG